MADHNRKPATQKRSPGSRKRQRAATCGKDVLELSRLPPEVLSHVFTFLSAEDVVRIRKRAYCDQYFVFLLL